MSQSHAILHCLRAPVGGLFRHVRDLATEQAKLGHKVGVLVDSSTADSLTESRLEEFAQHLELGLHRTAIGRNPGWRDIQAVSATKQLASNLSIDVLHGHGAKGGALARLAGQSLKRSGRAVKSFYTPHGGSLHYGPKSLKGRVFLMLERRLSAATDGIIFECEFAKSVFETNIGKDLAPTRVIHNGLHEAEFAEISQATSEDTRTDIATDKTDFVFIGELRALKGVDVLLNALAVLQKEYNATCSIVGDGPDGETFKAQANDLGLNGCVSFLGAMPARKAFELGDVLVMPSRKESFPYVVLEAGAAGLPMITTDVGGIPEIMHGTDMVMVKPDDSPALAHAMAAARQDLDGALRRAQELKSNIYQRFTVARMAAEILDFYESSGRS